MKETVVNLKSEIVVVGLPKNMDGSEGECAERKSLCGAFTQRNRVAGGFAGRKRYYHYSPQLFKRYKYKRQKRKNVVDEVAATIILQNYLDKRKNSKNY